MQLILTPENIVVYLSTIPCILFPHLGTVLGTSKILERAEQDTLIFKNIKLCGVPELLEVILIFGHLFFEDLGKEN